MLPDKEEANVPVCEGRVGDTPVRVLRDTGCSSIVVKEDLVPEEDKLKEYATLILADGTVRIFQRAMVDVYTPYLCGRVKAFCMKTPVYDLIIGNVEGVRNVDAPDPHWDAERCAVTTRRQAKTEGQTIPLKVAEEVDLAVINPEKLKELQGFSTGLIWEVMWRVSAGHATYASAPSARAEYQKFPFRRCH